MVLPSKASASSSVLVKGPFQRDGSQIGDVGGGIDGGLEILRVVTVVLVILGV